MQFVLTGDTVYASHVALREIEQLEWNAETSLRVSRIADAIGRAITEIARARDRARERWAVKFPPTHPTHAGRPVPVYRPGTPEDQQRPDNVAAIIPTAMLFTDDDAITAELIALGSAPNEIQCPVLTSEDIASSGLRIKPVMLKALAWNIDARDMAAAADIRPDRRRRGVAVAR